MIALVELVVVFLKGIAAVFTIWFGTRKLYRWIRRRKQNKRKTTVK